MNKFQSVLLKPLRILWQLKQQNQFSSCSILEKEMSNELLKKKINNDDIPLMVSRYSSEIRIINIYRQKQLKKGHQFINYISSGTSNKYSNELRFIAHNNAGIFPTDDFGLDRYAETIIEASKKIDILRIFNLEIPFFDFIGKISYGIYVFHPLIIFYLSKILIFHNSSFLNYSFVYFSVFLITISLSYFSYQYFEKRFLSLKHKYSTITSQSALTNN